MKWKKYTALLLAASCVVMTGCRESEVIQNVILTADASEVDDTEVLDSEQQEQIDEMAQFLSEKQQEEAKQDPDNVESAAKAGEDASDSESESNSGYRTGETGEEQEAAEGGSSANSGDSNKGSVTGPDADDKTDEEYEEKDDQEDNPDPEDTEGNGINSAGRLEDDPNARQIYDADGNIVTLPEFVTSVAATSDAGLIAQMLGGNGILAASSEDLLTNSLAQEVFADEGISDAVPLWEGDGSDGMTPENFQKLVELHPDCVILSNGDTLSEDQNAKLKEADIPVYNIPELSTAENIEKAVAIVGETLGDNTSKGGLNSRQLAADYLTYERDLVAEVSEKNGISSWLGYNFYNIEDRLTDTSGTYSPTTQSKITLYIDGWDEEAYIHTNDTLIKQDGIAFIQKDYAYHAMTWYLSNAGIVDAVSQTSVKGNLYLCPLYGEVIGKDANGNEQQYGYGSANFFNSHAVPGGIFTTNELFGIYYAQKSTSRSSYLGFLGDNTFPAVLVSTEEIRKKLEESQNSSAGLYRKGRLSSNYYARLTDNFLIYWDGRIPNYNSATWIDDDYDIYINPCGVGSWTDGSVEGFLETIWASSKFYGSYSQSDVNAKIEDFYKKFYRHKLTDTQLNDILDGL